MEKRNRAFAATSLLASLTSGLLQVLYFIGALGCLYLSLRAYFRVKTSPK